MHNSLISRMTILYFILYLCFSYFFAISDGQTQPNPFSPNASLIRYWNKQVLNNLPKPSFLFSKSSPLNTIDSAFLSKLANNHTLLSTHLDSFCSLANLFCSFDAKQDLNMTSTIALQDASFAVYSNKRFSTYGASKRGGVDSFKNYSDGINSASGTFIKYSMGSTGHSETFASYARDGNIANSTFGNYASGATGGSGQFKSYAPRVNVPRLRFTTYDSDGKSHKLSFSSYSDQTNSGSQTFTSYGKKARSTPSKFINYSDGTNIIDSTFTGYGGLGNAVNDSFAGYGIKGNNPHNNFKNYGVGGNSGVDSFSNYRNGANVGKDSFETYARNSNSGKVSFSNYGKTFNPGNDTFKDYGKGSKGGTKIGFKGYSKDRSFKDYINKGVTFAGYTTISDSSGSFVNKWVEEGKFFREFMLKQGNVMAMPDIKDKMPERSFLPRSIESKLPFSTSSLSELKEIFQARGNSNLERLILNALSECERAPSPGETKMCVGSIEDMLDFAVSVLGHNLVVRTTETVNGSKQSVMLGLVKGINGGRVTESVSCHQSLYPYLLYYCHSVPKVRVYEVDIHDVENKALINRGIAICHLDTSAWNPEHGAFVALGSTPGQIEVCHWIFQNDMTWTTYDD